MSHWAITRLLSTIRLLKDRREGTTVIIAAVAAPVVIGSLALAIDTGVWYMEKRKTQQMADAATVGAVRIIKAGGTVATARQVALNDAKRNGYTELTGNSFVFNSPVQSGPYAGQSNTAEVIITRKLPRFFASVTAIVGARSVAYKPVVLGKNLEVALMLDVSGSMAGDTEVQGFTKVKAMQDAAKSLIDTVVQPSQTPYTSRVALVPYATAVNVGSGNVTVNGVTKNLYKMVTNQDITTNGHYVPWTSVVERGGDAKFTDDVPGPNKWLGELKTKKEDGLGKYRSWVRSLNSNTPASTIKPLSTDRNDLKATVNNLTAYGATAGHVGVAWTWYLLSPKWSGIWTGGATPNAYDATATYKAVVLLSDFEVNTWYVSANGDMAAQMQALCTNMKTAGIVVYTVGYNVDRSDTKAVNVWNNCASDSTKVYSADTVSELVAAFKAIAQATLNGALNDDISLGE